jgi:uncharacterized protein
VSTVGSRSQNTASRWNLGDPVKVTRREIRFTDSGVALSGTAYVPGNAENVPGVVVLHGAAGPLRSARLYDHLREGLPRIGFAVLAFDRRGTGKSSGDPSVDYEALAADAVAGQKALGGVPGVDPKRIGFWGISQGGWIALLAATRATNPAFVVSVSTPLCSVARQMDFATSNLLRVRGYSDSEVRELMRARGAWLSYLRGKSSLRRATALVGRAQRRRWFGLAFMPPSEKLESSRGALTEMEFDPFDAVLKLTIPTLFVYGSRDPWVPVRESITWLLRECGKNANIRWVVVPGANHEMNLTDLETMDFDPKTLQRSAPNAPAYFMELASWLATQRAEGQALPLAGSAPRP